MPLAGVQYDQRVPPRIEHDGAPPDLDVEWPRDQLPARLNYALDRCVRRCDPQVHLQLRSLCLDHDLRVRLGHPQAGRGLRAPDQLVPELVAVECETGVEVRNGDLEAVDVSEESYVRVRFGGKVSCNYLRGSARFHHRSVDPDVVIKI